jgi:hypothetical protein
MRTARFLAEGKLPSDDGSSWTKFDYLELRQTLEEIVLCMETMIQQMESLPDLAPMESQPAPRLVISNDQPEIAKAPSLEEPQEPAA